MTPESDAVALSTFIAGPRRISEAIEGLTEEEQKSRATDEAMQRTGIHPEHGEMTVQDLQDMYAAHGEGHREQILEIRKLRARP